MRGVGPTRRWRAGIGPRCTTTPEGAERDPHPRPSSPGSAPTSSSSAAQVRPGRDRAGWGCRAPLLSLPPPAATRVAMATARVPAPHRGGVKSPALCKFRAGWAGMRGPGRLGARARLSRLLPAWPGRRAGGGRPGGRGGKERSGPGRRGFVSFVRGGGSAAAGGAGSGRSFPPLGLRVTAAAPSDPPPGGGGVRAAKSPRADSRARSGWRPPRRTSPAGPSRVVSAGTQAGRWGPGTAAHPGVKGLRLRIPRGQG